MDKFEAAMAILNIVLARLGNVSVQEAIDWAKVEENAEQLQKELEADAKNEK